MEANILLGFAWNDRPWTASTVFAVSEGDPERAKAEALHLAAAFWARRNDFKLRMETAEVAEGIARAAAAAEAPIFLSDAGDNTTAGAAGDLTTVLQAALDRPDVAIAVPGITAPKTVAALVKAGVGATVTIELGAEHLSRPKTSRQVEVVVEAAEPALRLEGFQPYRSSEFAWARVRIGKTVATFHERAIGVTTPAHLRALGVDPATQRIIVVKLGYLHPQLEDIAGRHILLLSDGTAQPDVTRLAWKVLKRPAWPLDGEFPWRPEDGLYQTKR